MNDLAKWIANKENSDSKKFRMLLAKAYKIIKNAPWMEFDTTARTQLDIENINPQKMGKDTEFPTIPTYEVWSEDQYASLINHRTPIMWK